MGRETYTGDVAFEVRGSLGIITVNRPHALNALTGLMCESITVQLQEWKFHDDVAQVLVRGAGERGLCAGADVTAFYRDMVAHQGADGGSVLPHGTPGYAAAFDSEQMLATEYRMNQIIAAYPKPYIALMDGLVLGGGVGLSAHGSHRVVTERSRVGMPETTIGFCPDVGATWLLAQQDMVHGLYAGLSGTHMGAAEAIAVGLADAQLPTAEIGEFTEQLTSRDADEVLAQYGQQPDRHQNSDWLHKAFSAETVPALLAALDELGKDHPGAAEAADQLRRKSPTMLQVAHRAIRTAGSLSLEQSLAQEYTIAVHALRSHDFREGIRAQVIDKDRSPQWEPGEVSEVDPAVVETYFTEVPGHQLSLERR